MSSHPLLQEDNITEDARAYIASEWQDMRVLVSENESPTVDFSGFQVFYVCDPQFFTLESQNTILDPDTNTFEQEFVRMVRYVNYKVQNKAIAAQTTDFMRKYADPVYYHIRTFDSIWIVKPHTIISPMVFKLEVGYQMLELQGIDLPAIAALHQSS